MFGITTLAQSRSMAWLVKILKKLFFTSQDLNDKILLANFQQLKYEHLYKN